MITFIGIGVQKCASSWIYEVLKGSNQTCLSDTKELNFFSYFFDQGFEWYESNFLVNNESVVGEISPSYFYNSDTPKRVFEYNPEMKIVISLRDPIKRMYSNHLHEVRAGNVSGDNLIFENAIRNNPLYFEQSCYAVHIKKWLAYFPSENIHIVFQEDVAKSPKLVSDTLCDFLAIDRLPLIETVKVNESLLDKNRVLGKALNIGGDIFRKLGLKESVNTLKRTKLLGTLYTDNKIHISETVPHISPEYQSHLQELFVPRDQELKSLLEIKHLPWEK